MLLSKLVHYFIALPNPSPKCLKEIETTFFKFVWDGKNDRIKRTKITQNYEDDGLKMINVKAFVESMKVSWLKRMLTSNADWTHTAKLQIPNVTQLLTYGKEKLLMIRNKMTNLFYIVILNVLIKFTIQYEPSIDEVLSETIWFSDHTGFPKSIIKHWDRQGLRFISDMFKPSTGQLCTKEEMQEKFQIHMTFLCYERLVRKLPNSLQSTGGRSIQSPNIPFKIKMMQNKTKCTREC